MKAASTALSSGFGRCSARVSGPHHPKITHTDRSASTAGRYIGSRKPALAPSRYGGNGLRSRARGITSHVKIADDNYGHLEEGLPMGTGEYLLGSRGRTVLKGGVYAPAVPYTQKSLLRQRGLN